VRENIPSRRNLLPAVQSVAGGTNKILILLKAFNYFETQHVEENLEKAAIVAIGEGFFFD